MAFEACQYSAHMVFSLGSRHQPLSKHTFVGQCLSPTSQYTVTTLFWLDAALFWDGKKKLHSAVHIKAAALLISASRNEVICADGNGTEKNPKWPYFHGGTKTGTSSITAYWYVADLEMHFGHLVFSFACKWGSGGGCGGWVVFGPWC